MGGKIGVWDVATGAECRTLHPEMLGNRSEARDATGVTAADVSPDGRLVATGGGDGVRLWESDTGRELAQLKAGGCDTVLFHPDGQSLISSSKWGLYRWPIRLDPERGPDAIRVGPPELLREPAGSWRKATWLPDHRTLALIDDGIARVLLVDSYHPHPARSRATALDSGENRRMTTVAVSPDGRWLAVGGWYEAGVRVWGLRRRRLERILRPKEAVGITKFFIGFSPDGRWLISNTIPDASTQFYQFWRVGTWELDLLICGILMWGQVGRFGLTGDRVDESQIGAGIGELGRVEMFQQMSDYAVGPRVRHRMDVHTQDPLLQIGHQVGLRAKQIAQQAAGVVCPGQFLTHD